MKKQQPKGAVERPMPALLDADDLAHHLQINRRRVFEWVSAGVLPQPIRLTKKTLRWPRSVLEQLTGGSA